MNSGSISLGLIRQVLLEDRERTVMGVFDSMEGETLTYVALNGERCTVNPSDPAGVRSTLDDVEVTTHRGKPLVFVNETYGLMGVAFGPTEAPRRLVVTAVLDLDDVSIPTDGEQPGWRLFRTVST